MNSAASNIERKIGGSLDDQAIIEAGYKPQLLRRLGFFSSFAISFSYMSVLTGIFANYAFALGKAGPFGFWTWILVGFGQTLTALVFAEMAGRIPLTGCSYNWNNKLTNPVVGWFAGWMALVAYTVGVAAVTVTIFPVINSLFGFTVGSSAVPYVGLALILLQAAINVYGVRAAAYINLVAVCAEIAAALIFGILLTAIWISNGHSNVELLTTIPSEPKPYFPAFLMACLLPSWTLLGFEGAADISEETINVRKVAPKGIIQSVLACSLLGFAFTMILTLAIPNLSSVSTSADPVTAIVSTNLGAQLTKLFLVLLLISVIACSLVNMTGASRVLFAMSRDRRIVGASWLARVSSHKVPGNATWLVAIVSGIFLLISDRATALYGAGAVLFTMFYLLTVTGYVIGLKRLPPTESFSLGRWRWPVVILAVAWLSVEIAILTVPGEFHAVALATAVVLIVGAGLYLIAGRTGQPDAYVPKVLTQR
jgi:amino acid transporter